MKVYIICDKYKRPLFVLDGSLTEEQALTRAKQLVKTETVLSFMNNHSIQLRDVMK
jgi:hypothetical protein